MLPARAIDKYYDVGLFWYQVAAAIVVLTIIAVIRRKARTDAEAVNARYYAELTFDELGGILINFGSLAFVTAWVSHDGSPLFATGLNYVIGYFLIRKSEADLSIVEAWPPVRLLHPQGHRPL